MRPGPGGHDAPTRAAATAPGPWRCRSPVGTPGAARRRSFAAWRAGSTPRSAKRQPSAETPGAMRAGIGVLARSAVGGRRRCGRRGTVPAIPSSRPRNRGWCPRWRRPGTARGSPRRVTGDVDAPPGSAYRHLTGVLREVVPFLHVVEHQTGELARRGVLTDVDPHGRVRGHPDTWAHVVDSRTVPFRRAVPVDRQLGNGSTAVGVRGGGAPDPGPGTRAGSCLCTGQPATDNGPAGDQPGHQGDSQGNADGRLRGIG